MRLWPFREPPAEEVGMRGLRRSEFLGLLAFLCAGLQVGRGAAPPLPNIVLIYVGESGYGDVGCYGAQRIKTPKIDRLDPVRRWRH
jgi:hypothetical protein